MAGSLYQARTMIRTRLDTVMGGVFTVGALAEMLANCREEWGAAQSVTTKAFVQFLVKRMGLRTVELKSERYRPVVRYAREDYSPYQMALSLRPRSYLTHGTAVLLHGLNAQLPKTIYANQEQSAKPVGGSLTQTKLDRAFAGRQRTSSYVYSLEGWRVVLLSGKQTGNFGVESLTGPVGEDLQVTGIARTLVDIVVRPAYAGGILQVLEAYRGARDRVDAGALVQTLEKLGHIYPYHQAIGFLMERAGYPAQACDKLRRLGAKFDFYLIHGMKEPQYDANWRLHFPQGL
jgi:predicted transcriptional regulator of viral defense system